jgi:hypothetical protein
MTEGGQFGRLFGVTATVLMALGVRAGMAKAADISSKGTMQLTSTAFAEGEAIHTEWSYKYTVEDFRALAASFTVAAFTAILLMALGADISLSGEHRGPVNSIPAADMVAAFHYVFAAAAALLACGALCMVVMEEKPLAGPATPVEMAE